MCGRNPGPTTSEWARGALPQTHVQAQCVRRYRILCKEGEGGGNHRPNMHSIAEGPQDAQGETMPGPNPAMMSA